MRHKSVLGILAVVLGFLFFEFFRETYWAIAVDAFFEHMATSAGIEKPALIAAAFQYLLWFTAAFIVIWIAYAIGQQDRAIKSPLEIQYRPNDPRHVEATGGLYGGASRYYVEILNRATDRTIHDLEVVWDRTPFTVFIDSQTRQPVLCQSERLDPRESRLVYLFGFDDSILTTPDPVDVLRHASHFIVRARGRGAAEVTAEFEYSPLRFPKLLKVR
jgi:hypothetical protein